MAASGIVSERAHRYGVGMDEIYSLLAQLPEDEVCREHARRHMDDYRGFALARPTQPHVDLLKAVLTTKLRELLALANREEKM